MVSHHHHFFHKMQKYILLRKVVKMCEVSTPLDPSPDSQALEGRIDKKNYRNLFRGTGNVKMTSPSASGIHGAVFRLLESLPSLVLKCDRPSAQV